MKMTDCQNRIRCGAAWCGNLLRPKVLLVSIGLLASQVAGAEPRIMLHRGQDGSADRFEVVGLTLDEIRAANLGEQLQVFVRGAGGSAPTLFGVHSRSDNGIVFEPRFPLRPGLSYRAVYRGSVRTVERSFDLPSPPPPPPAEVTAVYPSPDQLPENQLKLYLHFSRPMSRGEAYAAVRLFKQGGPKIEFPFLELEQELWDATATRFTLFFDPGRVKRGLKPREIMGPALETGDRYRLEIDYRWRDSNGRPMESSFIKVFSVNDPDYDQPDPDRWTLLAPRAGTVQPLRLLLNEPLDHAMLHRVLEVRSKRGETVGGEIYVDQGERRWSFTPDSPWKEGDYEIAIDTILEDLAGNSIAQPFEIDVFEKVDAILEQEQVKVNFRVGS